MLNKGGEKYLENKYIPMEAETLSMLKSGFIIVIVIVAICIITMLIKYRNKSLLWFAFQLIFISFGFKFVLDVLNNNVTANDMLSEETSLSIGLSALFWAISMVFMVIGIWRLVHKNKTRV